VVSRPAARPLREQAGLEQYATIAAPRFDPRKVAKAARTFKLAAGPGPPRRCICTPPPQRVARPRASARNLRGSPAAPLIAPPRR